MNLAESLDHVGPLTRSARDAGIMLEAISGHDPNDPTTLIHKVPKMLSNIGKGVKGMKIGWDETYSLDELGKEWRWPDRVGEA